MADGVPASAVPAQTAALTLVVNAAAASQSQLLISGGQDDQVPLVDVAMVAEGPNSLFRDQDVHCKEARVTASLQRIQAASAGQRKDVFGDLHNLASHLSSVSYNGPVDVVLLTDMTNTTAPVDMADQAVLKRGAGAMLGMASAGSALPDCTGWRVYAIGPAAAGTDLGANAVIRDFWSKFFSSCGGALVVYDTDLVTFPVAGAHPSVTPTPTPGTVTLTLPSDTLFALSSATLSPDAAASLSVVVADIDKDHPTSILVEGHTDNVPGPNQALSEARAAAVKDALVSKGVPDSVIATRGWGDTRPVAPNTDAAGRAKNRRVVVTLAVDR
jgi:flagellar motor protein MotB